MGESLRYLFAYITTALNRVITVSIRFIMELPKKSRYIEDEISDSDDDTSSDISLDAKVKTEECKDEYFTDAATDADIFKVSLPARKTRIQIGMIPCIERALSEDDKISLLFLMNDWKDSATVLELMENIVENPNKQFLDISVIRWNSNCINWQQGLVEALSVMQNYKILRELGFNKEDLKAEFLPRQECFSKHINSLKKCLYLISEKLGTENEKDFIGKIKQDFIAKKLCLQRYKYMEMYFLYLFTIDYLDINNLHNISSAFKVLDLENICDIFENYNKYSNKRLPQNFTSTKNSIESQNSLDMAHASNFHITTQKRENRVLQNHGVQGFIEKYDMSLPGLFILFNQVNFYKEFDPNYKDLVAPNLVERKGSDFDKEKLEQTFEKKGFKVETYESKTHFDILTTIETALKRTKDHSCLIICVLSHGEQGVIYGSNSCPVQVSKMRELMCSSNDLRNKPKILILQSCQGSECQEVDSDLVKDGPSGNKPMKYSEDSLTFWATVPGYSAIRHKKQGTWFIQSLCSKIEEYGNTHHFEDICISIINEVSKKTYKDNGSLRYMVPLKESTLTKALYFNICITNNYMYL